MTCYITPTYASNNHCRHGTTTVAVERCTAGEMDPLPFGGPPSTRTLFCFVFSSSWQFSTYMSTKYNNYFVVYKVTQSCTHEKRFGA